MRRGRLRRGEAGVSLVELLIAVAILSIAVVGLFRVFGAGASAAGAEAERLLARQVLANRAEEIALGLTGLPEDVALGGRDWRIDTGVAQTSGGFSEVTLSARPEGGGAGASLVVFARSAP